MSRCVWAVVLFAFAAPLPSLAATTTTWDVNGFVDLVKGRLTNVSLTADGRLLPGPATEHAVDLNQPAAWSIAPGPNGSVYVGTGHSGGVLRVDRDGKATSVWSGAEPEVFALAVEADGDVLAGTSPNGAVYRIHNGHAAEVWRPGAKYIWALAVGLDGAVYVGTGDGGKIFRIDHHGKASLFYDTGQMNVTALALTAAGHLIAGTDPNGLIYDVAPGGKARVMYDSNLPEIRSLALAPDGTIYAAAMGGAVASRNANMPASAQTATPAPATAATPTVITVTEASGNVVDQTSTATASTQASSGTSASQTGATAAAANVTEVAGVEKSAIYKIAADGTVDSIWSSKDVNVYDLALDGNSLVFSTDFWGTLYRLNGRETTVLTQLADGTATRVLARAGTLYTSLSNPGRLYVLGSPGKAARYESEVHDTGSVSRWGHLRWHGDGVAGVTFRTRSGFTARPDATWSEWAAPVAGAIASPSARFVQWAAEWSDGSSSAIDDVAIGFLPQNRAPQIHSIMVTSVANANAQKQAPQAAANSSSTYSITVTDTGTATSGTTASSQNISHLPSTQTQITWQADDPDGDRLAYSVYFRPQEGSAWQLARSRIVENSLLLDPDVFADGRYYFKIVATDAPSNDQQFAKQSELISSQVLIDNTPPLVSIESVKRDGDSADLDVTGVDATSPLRVCEYSVDAEPWQPIESTSGITDELRQKFHLHLDSLHAGEHLVVFRIYDAAENAGLAKAILH